MSLILQVDFASLFSTTLSAPILTEDPRGLQARLPLPVHIVAKLPGICTWPATLQCDQVTTGKDGALWVVANDDDTGIAASPKSRRVQVVAGAKDPLTVAGATGVAFGRTKKDKYVLHVSTANELDASVNVTVVEAGKVKAVKSATMVTGLDVSVSDTTRISSQVMLEKRDGKAIHHESTL